MLTGLDESLFHQLPTSFDHVGTSDPRFFDRLWFAASDKQGKSALQFTLGVYQNMNVVDGGFVFILDGQQHNLRVSRQLRPVYETACGPLRLEIVAPMRHVRLHLDHDDFKGTLDWTATLPPQEEKQHYKRLNGRVLEDYARYDQIGRCSGRIEIAGQEIELDSWWSCRDHSWGVRERVGVPEPRTGEVTPPQGGLFAFLFYATETHGGHVQVAHGLDGSRYLSAAILDRATGQTVAIGDRAEITARFVDDARPRRMEHVTFVVVSKTGEHISIALDAEGPAVAMQGLGYGGYNDGLGLGVWRGLQHMETDTWNVSHAAEVTYPDGRVDRPVHRIQPVRVTQTDAAGTSHGHGSLTFIAEGKLEVLGVRVG